MLKTLEDTLHSGSTGTTNSFPATATGDDQVASLQKMVKALTEINEVLVGYASHLQSANKSLQNQLYMQHDWQSYLNLHLGGVEDLDS